MLPVQSSRHIVDAASAPIMLMVCQAARRQLTFLFCDGLAGMLFMDASLMRSKSVLQGDTSSPPRAEGAPLTGGTPARPAMELRLG